MQDFVFGKATNLVIEPGWIESEGHLVTLAKKNEWRDQNNMAGYYAIIKRDARLGRTD